MHRCINIYLQTHSCNRTSYPFSSSSEITPARWSSHPVLMSTMAPRPSSVPDNQSDRDGIDAEKGSSQLHEHIQQSGTLAAEDAEFLAHFTDAQRKRVLRKVDWRLVPMLLILYLISFIDRANIGTYYWIRVSISRPLAHVSMSRQCEDRGSPAQPGHERYRVQHRSGSILHPLYFGR